MSATRAAKALSNAQIAELLACEAEASNGILVRAFRRAARSAFFWPEEVVDLAAQNRPLTELRAVGPFIAKRIQRWNPNTTAAGTKTAAAAPRFLRAR